MPVAAEGVFRWHYVLRRPNLANRDLRSLICTTSHEKVTLLRGLFFCSDSCADRLQAFLGADRPVTIHA
jgi:hypothetical protein